ncbi:methyl-CpG-binding domain-containing protein 13-like isoform X3 [Vitis riparia]|uniref:methyl-CpG-binding domain-containing protein 13-like isoform X3 n=1 Tax=Vitis riparia TaxID=96939 RepID=UPI00155A765B|nr:methyl-CpG-binding domain-containing protein 13-like isoform X3 [Vitis riparia]
MVENSPDWIPEGWTVQVKLAKNGRNVKYYFNSKTGQKFFSKNDIIRYVKRGSIHCDTSQPINMLNKRRSQNKIMPLGIKTKKFPDWLPNGWILELKTQRSGSCVGKQYKCYLDPSTGYRFYSKPDVFRYLKTIKHNSCTSRQKKVEPGMPSLGKVVIERSTADGLPAGWIKEIKIRMNENGIRRDPPPPGAKRQKLMHQKTRRCLFSATASADTGSSEMSNLSLPENQGSRQTKQLFSKPKFALEPPTETLQEKLLVENEKYAESKKSSGRRNSDLQKDKGSKRKSKNKDCNLPCRSSKRLAGLKPDLVGNSGSSEQALAVADKISGKSEVIPALGVIMGSLDNTACCQLEVVLEAEPGHHASRAIEAPSDVEQSKKDNRHLEDEAVQEEEAGKLETGKKTGDEPELPPMDFPFMDVWSDPCLEFAFKTLTGAIPIEDNLEIEGYFQQQIDSSHTQNSSPTLPDFGLPSSQFDAQEKSVPRQHFASKPSVLPKEM